MHQVRALPESPGVYLMRDANEDIIYIGKALKLRTRVRSYFGSGRSMEPKVRALAEEIQRLEHVVTKTEAEALHLEATLVKRHQPRYNVRLKDDKHYPYLKIDVKYKLLVRSMTTELDISDHMPLLGPSDMPLI